MSNVRACNSIKRTSTRDLTCLVEKSLLVKHGERKELIIFFSPQIPKK